MHPLKLLLQGSVSLSATAANCTSVNNMFHLHNTVTDKAFTHNEEQKLVEYVKDKLGTQ
jgi:hypothetical protein